MWESSVVEEQLLIRNVERFREALEFKAHRLLYHSTLGSRAIKKKKKLGGCECACGAGVATAGRCGEAEGTLHFESRRYKLREQKARNFHLLLSYRVGGFGGCGCACGAGAGGAGRLQRDLITPPLDHMPLT